MWETIRGYLTFTRKERYGVLFLLAVMSALFVLPYFFRPSVGDRDPAAYEKMKEGILKSGSRVADSSREAVDHHRYPDPAKYAPEDISGKATRASRAEMFYFDPNKINGAEWRRLGLSERLTQTILHYREKGGRFHKPEDLKKLYGLRNPDYERLFPYVLIARPPDNFQTRSGHDAETAYEGVTVKKADSFFREDLSRMSQGKGIVHRGKKPEITDINRADSADWSRLPGIGAKLASRIVHFRDKLGGFYEPGQVGETFGLPDSAFQKIKPFLRLTTVTLVQLDLNHATKESLQAHPYIRWQIARGIMEYRVQHGSFHSVDELLQLAQMDQEKFEKLKPYLVVKP